MPVLGTELIDSTLQTVVQIQNEKKHLFTQNEALIEKVLKLQDQKEVEINAKDHYM